MNIIQIAAHTIHAQNSTWELHIRKTAATYSPAVNLFSTLNTIGQVSAFFTERA